MSYTLETSCWLRSLAQRDTKLINKDIQAIFVRNCVRLCHNWKREQTTSFIEDIVVPLLNKRSASGSASILSIIYRTIADNTSTDECKCHCFHCIQSPPEPLPLVNEWFLFLFWCNLMRFYCVVFSVQREEKKNEDHFLRRNLKDMSWWDRDRSDRISKKIGFTTHWVCRAMHPGCITAGVSPA